MSKLIEVSEEFFGNLQAIRVHAKLCLENPHNLALRRQLVELLERTEDSDWHKAQNLFDALTDVGIALRKIPKEDNP